MRGNLYGKMTLKDYLNDSDRFAASNGIRLTDIQTGFATAEMTVSDKHLNAAGVCQGGAVFTLADLAMAAAFNSGRQLTVGIQNSVSFLQSALKGDVLTAEAQVVFDHKKIPFVNATVRRQDGEIVAVMTGQGYKKRDEIKFDTLI